MKLIFLRHGKAEERSIEVKDYDRVLTNEGISLLEQDMPFLANYIRHTLQDNSISIWTSPLCRARQTADILHKYLPESELKIVNSLGDGDFDLLKEEFSWCSNQFIICVGHNPFFDDWGTQFTGTDISFKKGEATEFIINDTNKWKGKLNISFKPTEYGLEVNKIILSDFFSTYYNEIKNKMSIFLDKSYKPNTVHNFRISIRRYRCLLDLHSPIMNRELYLQLDQKLKQLLKELAKVREFDVLIKRVEKYPGREKQNHLIEQIINLRQEEAIKVKEKVEGIEYREEIKNIFKITMDAFSNKKIKTVNLDEFLQSRVGEWKVDLVKMREELNIKKVKEIHRYRIYWKKLRYALEALGYIDEENYNEAKLSQDQLGKICDSEVNIKLINELEDGNDKHFEEEKKVFIKSEKKRGNKNRKQSLNK